jgi:putative spermidine/putrescine transport system substrate-binding protein
VKARLIAITVAVLVFVPTALSATHAGGHVKKANAGTTIVVYASGDVNVQNLWQSNIIPNFEKRNKGLYVKFIFSEHGTDDGTTLARIGAAVKGRHWPGIDLVDGGLVTTMAAAGLNQPVAKATAPNLKRVNKDLLAPVKGAAIPYRGSSVVLAYNTDKVKSPPRTLSALLDWIRANPGKFTYNSPNSGGSGYAFAETVVDSLLSPPILKQMDQGYDTSLQSNWKDGLALLHGLNKYMYGNGVYPNGNAAVLQLLAQGQLWLAPVWSDQALTALKSGQLGPNIKLTQISNPPFTGGAAYLAVPKTAKHKKVLYRFVNYILSPAAQQMIVDVMAGYPAIDVKYMSDSIKQKFQDVSANTLRPTYQTKMGNDFKAAWQQSVP